jgi:hypothetical protein
VRERTGGAIPILAFVQFSSSAEAVRAEDVRSRSLKTEQRRGGPEGPLRRSGRRVGTPGRRQAAIGRTPSAGHRYGDRLVELPRKEVIQPQLPLRLPCYDFTPITSPTFDGSLP